MSASIVAFPIVARHTAFGPQRRADAGDIAGCIVIILPVIRIERFTEPDDDPRAAYRKFRRGRARRR